MLKCFNNPWVLRIKLKKNRKEIEAAIDDIGKHWNRNTSSKVEEKKRRKSVWKASVAETERREEILFPNGTFRNDDDSKKPSPDVSSISDMWNLKPSLGNWFRVESDFEKEINFIATAESWNGWRREEWKRREAPETERRRGKGKEKKSLKTYPRRIENKSWRIIHHHSTNAIIAFTKRRLWRLSWRWMQKRKGITKVPLHCFGDDSLRNDTEQHKF